jgi:hypothetical protein
MSLALCVFFFPVKSIQKLFFKNKLFYDKEEIIVPSYKPLLLTVFGLYFLIQLALPLRHWFIKDDVLWTEEAHRLSWRMMLRAKKGIAHYTVVDKETHKKISIKLDDYLSKNQQNIASSKPDVIWQFAQRLKQEFATKGKDIAVYVNCKISVNNRPFKQLIDPKVDLASVKWELFKHNVWILPSNED